MVAQHKKNYTNADIYKKLDDMDGRLRILETWKLSQDAGRAAVDEYKLQETDRNKANVVSGIKDLMPYISIIVVGLAVIVYALATRAK